MKSNHVVSGSEMLCFFGAILAAFGKGYYVAESQAGIEVSVGGGPITSTTITRLQGFDSELMIKSALSSLPIFIGIAVIFMIYFRIVAIHAGKKDQ